MRQPNGSVSIRTRARRGGIAVGLVLVVSASLLPGAIGAEADQRAAPVVPQIHPVPQSLVLRSDRVTVTPEVQVVVGALTDASALGVAEGALRGAGARTFVSGTAPNGSGDLVVRLGGADEDQALRTFGVPGTSGLPAEGYELAAGSQTIVLAGADRTGEFYAAQTLRQIIEQPGAEPQHAFTGLAVRDWPATTLRGVVEGFYGTPWSDQELLDQFDFYGAYKMNLYVYSPKDDPYLRAHWRAPYPADRLAAIGRLVARAAADHVTFTYALSPGLSVCYSSDADGKALIAKFQSLWDIGVRSFAVPLDDIRYTVWNCPADRARWGTGRGAAGSAQSYLLNKVERTFVATHPGTDPLQMVPTEYSNTTPSPYKTALAAQLDRRALVEWTGDGGAPVAITAAQARRAQQVFGHSILVWDNYPVNDYVTQRLLLAPSTGRSPDLTGQITGLTANPMIQPYASKIALFTVADYLWNSAAYNPQQSWTASLNELAGGDPPVVDALRAFADLNYTSRLGTPQAPGLAAAVGTFWSRWTGAPQPAAQDLLRYLTVVAAAPAVLRSHLPSQQLGFVTDAAPWLDATQDWGQAMLTALDMIVQQRAGHGAAARADRQRLPALVNAASSHTYTGLSGTRVVVRVGDGVADAFVRKATSVSALGPVDSRRWH